MKLYLLGVSFRLALSAWVCPERPESEGCIESQGVSVYSCRVMGSGEARAGGKASIRVLGDSPGDRERAERLSKELGLPLREASPEAGGEAMLLVSGGWLGLQVPRCEERQERGSVFFPDWTRIDTDSPAGRRSRQPLVRAVQGRRGRKGLVVWDGTAGWGEDAWILAALGHRVVAMERDPLIHRCLLDAWSRAGAEAPFAARRIRPVHAESETMLRRLAVSSGVWKGPPPPEVVYLDPFFPAQGGKKAREKKNVRLLRLAADSGSGDARDLLSSALAVPGVRVVLKRPPRARALAPDGRGPVHSIAGRGFRYDIYISSREPT